MVAPIIVFAFNRADVLDDTLQALAANELAADSPLYIFVDGPRSEQDVAKIEAVKRVVEKPWPFKSVERRYAAKNKGLARSIIEGTTEIINRFGRVIVVEDDLHVSKGFLRFMNVMLDRYEHDERVFQVSGFGVKLANAADYPYDYYMHIRAHSWTWGTWKDRWESVDWAVLDFPQFCKDSAKQRAFNKGGSDLTGMLKGFFAHKNNSWYIRFTYSMFCQGRYAVMPVRSLVINNGFRPESTHCNAYNRYKVDFNEQGTGRWNEPEHLEFNAAVSHEATKYWTIRYRIYGKLMTWLYRLKR